MIDYQKTSCLCFFFVSFEDFVVASFMEDFCFNIRRLIFSAIDLPSSAAGEEERRVLLFYLFGLC